MRKSDGTVPSARLRAATARVHRDLEAEPLLMRLMGDDATEDAYVSVVAAFAAHAATWEPAVFDTLAPHVDASFLSARRKLPRLAADLAGLGLPIPPPKVRAPLDIGEAIGRFYVQEGATLGGLVIVKHLSRALPPHLRQHTAFFHGYGSDTARMWTESRNVIDRICAEHAVIDAAIEGARGTFLDLKASIRSLPKPPAQGASHHRPCTVRHEPVGTRAVAQAKP